MLRTAYFHSNTMGLNTTAAQLKAMGTLCGVPLQSLLINHIMPGKSVIQRNVKQVISFLNTGYDVYSGDRYCGNDSYSSKKP